MLKRWLHAHHLRVRLRVNQTVKAVAGIATNAAALPRVLLVQHDAERRVERSQAQPLPSAQANGPRALRAATPSLSKSCSTATLPCFGLSIGGLSRFTYKKKMAPSQQSKT